MNVRLKAQIVKELLSYLRDPKSRITLIVPPLLQLLIFSFAATLDVRHVDIAVMNRDGGHWSQEFVSRVRAAGFIGNVVSVDDPAEASTLLDRREVLAILTFPADFSRHVAAHRPAVAQLVVDGRRANTGQIVASYMNAIAAGLGAELSPVPVTAEMEVRHWFNPNLTYQWFVVPSLSGLLAMFIALIVTALSIARERELGTFDQLLVSPTTPLEIVIGKSVPAVIIGTILGSVMMAAAWLLFGVPFTGSLLLLMLCLVLFIFSVVGIGLAISALCQTQQQAILGAFATAVPIILISGFATPVENMPGWLQIVAMASPLKYFLIIVQGSFVKGMPATDVLANAWPMAVIAVVTLVMAVLIVRWKVR